jgi:diaminopimelate epimerase
VTVGVELPVVKMHGSHNFFVLLDERPARVSDYGGLAKTLCRIDSAVDGADGLLVVRDAPGYAAEMRVFNADGSEAEMCGNGVRCVARYLAERGAPDAFSISTPAGPIGVTIVSREPYEIRVDIGTVSFPKDALEETAAAPGGPWTFYDVSVGNPHAVLFVDDVNAADLDTIGVTLNWLERFPNGTNVHAVQIVDDRTLLVRHYERGVGLTNACGTGAVACAAVAIAVKGLQSPVDVKVPGGSLRVGWAPGDTAKLTGPAETIFERTIAP